MVFELTMCQERTNIVSYIHTYIIGQDYGPASHTIHIVCVNFIRDWLDLELKVDSKPQIFQKLFHARFIYFQSFCQKSAERKSPKKFIFFYIFRFNACPGIRIRALRLIGQHGEFIVSYVSKIFCIDYLVLLRSYCSPAFQMFPGNCSLCSSKCDVKWKYNICFPSSSSQLLFYLS